MYPYNPSVTFHVTFLVQANNDSNQNHCDGTAIQANIHNIVAPTSDIVFMSLWTYTSVQKRPRHLFCSSVIEETYSSTC